MISFTMRCAAFVVALFLATGAGATTRYWQLTGVVFDDGTNAVGSFSYDDATHTVGTWNIRVKAGASPLTAAVLPFTYVPGDSVALTFQDGDTSVWGVNFSSVEGGYYFDIEGGGVGVSERQLRITPVANLDGTMAVVPIDLATPFLSGSIECFNCGRQRVIVAGSLTLVLLPPPVALIQVVEFFHEEQNHYFISADPAEINGLDTGYFPGWTRTGGSFKAYVTGSSAGPSIHPVCRFYRPPIGGISTHFYSGDTHECYLVPVLFADEWQIESDNVFQIDLPDKTTGVCPGGTIPVYRLFNNIFATPNHRYTTSLVVVLTMVAAGWVREGYGPDSVIMCAVP